jgi:hypothetical protein
MNKQTAEKIASAASFLITSDALQYQQYLEPPFRLAVDILKVFHQERDKHYKSCEISEYLIKNDQIYREKGLNASTVCQILQALRKGGIPLSSNRKLGWSFQTEINS